MRNTLSFVFALCKQLLQSKLWKANQTRLQSLCLDYLNQKYWIVLKEDRVFLCVLCVLKLLIQRYGKPHNCFHPAHHLPASDTHPILHASSLYQPPTHRGNLPSPQSSTLSPLGLSGPLPLGRLAAWPLDHYTSIPQSPLLCSFSMSLYIPPPPYMGLYQSVYSR